MAQLYKIRKPTASSTLPSGLLNFGPLYRANEDFLREMKDEAWQHVLRKTHASEQSVRTSYSGALGRLEGQSRRFYDDVRGDLSEMMRVDGCLFLQLVILLLGGSNALGYPVDHPIFGNQSQEENTEKWIKSMLFVGNQIPFVVLHELMRQHFFRDVISSMALERPSSLFKIALYELLLFGFIDRRNTEGCWNGLQGRKLLQRDLLKLEKRPRPLDLIHSLRLLIVGAELQTNEDGDNYHTVVDVEEDFKIGNTKKLREMGIKIEKKDEIGSAGIRFERKCFSEVLYLPEFTVDEYTEQILKCLMNYEKAQYSDRPDKQEVKSYIAFMSELVTKASDAKFLKDQGIVHANLRQRGMLPGILKRVIEESEEVRAEDEGRVAVRCPNILKVKRQIREHYPSKWTDYLLREYKTVMAIIGVLQVIYAILAFHLGQKSVQNGHKAPPPPF